MNKMISTITLKIRNAGFENTYSFMPRIFLILFLIFLPDVFLNPLPLVAQQHINHTNLLEYYGEDGKKKPISIPADWYIRHKQILMGMQLAMGNLPDRHDLVDLDVEIINETKGNGFTRQSITFTGEPGDRIPALLYIPSNIPKDKKIPAMLTLHPTGPLGKLIVAGEGLLDNRQYGLELSQRGYVVICPDYPSFGDYNYDFEKDEYVSGTMKGIFNHMRCVDLLESLEYVDSEKIGVIGHSLGGHNAMFSSSSTHNCSLTFMGIYQRVLLIFMSCIKSTFTSNYY